MIAGHMPMLASFLSPSFGELALIGIIALLLYGSDLPSVIRSWGKTYADFRRHLNDMRSDLDDAMYAEPESPRRLQYYPEFQHDASDAVEVAMDDRDSSTVKDDAGGGNADKPASDESARHDTHGAA